MKTNQMFPQRDNNSILEDISVDYFKRSLPIEWYVEKPPRDFGIDLIVTPVINNNVFGLNFSVQLKAQTDTQGKLEVRLKKTTLNYLFNRLEPIMLVLYDKKANQAYWRWLMADDTDLTKPIATHLICFEERQNLSTIDWREIADHVQKIFKIKNMLLTSAEYDLFNTGSELEAKAWAHYLGKNYAEASFCFKRLIQQPNPSPIWFLVLAQSQYYIYDYKNALIYINKALDIDRDDNILLTKGCILAEDGIRYDDVRKLREAEKIFEELYDKEPSAMHAYNYANTLSKLGKLDQAEKLYKHALQLNPNYAEAWKNLGQLYWDLRKHDLELKCYESALAIKPGLIEAKVGKAITEGFVYNHYEGSIEVLLECCDQNELIYSEFPKIYYWLGYFYFKINNTVKALEWVEKGLANNPGDALLINLKANILIESIDTNVDLAHEAISFFTENYRLNKDDSVNFYFLCRSHEKVNDRQFVLDLALGWLRERPIVKAFSESSKVLISLDEALLIIRFWQVTQQYSFRYPIDSISAEFEYAEIQHYDEFLQLFEIRRMLFIAYLNECLVTHIQQSDLKNKATKLYKEWLVSFKEPLVSSLITSSTLQKEKFISEFAKVADLLGRLTFTEYTRCVAFVIGYNGLEKEYLSGMLIDESMFLEGVLHFITILYEKLGLPTESE